MKIESIPIVTVSYNSPELIDCLVSSLRKFYNNRLFVIDGSDQSNFLEIKKIVEKYEHIELYNFGYNIHHGPGMAWAISNLELTGPVLFLDSDLLVENKGFIESLYSYLGPGMYGVGNLHYVRESGHDISVGAAPETYQKGAIRYLHPACMLCNIEVMKEWPLPIKHGAPMIATMLALHNSGRSDLVHKVEWINIDLDKSTEPKKFIRHDWQGTVIRTGGYHLEESTAPGNYNRDLPKNDVASIVKIGCNNGESVCEVVRRCGVCGGNSFTSRHILWDALVYEWQLSPYEVEYIDRQQGEICNKCGANLRSIALANALRAYFGASSVLQELVQTQQVRDISILEINEAGTLTPLIRQFGHYTFGAYPEVDIHKMPYLDNSFDIVIHSDTLEHVENPVHALVECKRVLKPNGAMCFTVPVVVGRMTRNRAGLPKSYHGAVATDADDFIVHTEFGADVWGYVMEAGFGEVQIHAVEYPAAVAFLARKNMKLV